MGNAVSEPNEQTSLVNMDSHDRDENLDKEEKHTKKIEAENIELHLEADNWRNLSVDLDGIIQQHDQRIKQLDQRIEEVTTKLSQEMSNKLASNESSVENVSIYNRPMNVAGEYIHLCSNAWLDAKGALDQLADDNDLTAKLQKLTILCDILKVSETVCTESFKVWMNKLSVFMTDPFSPSTVDSNKEVKCLTQAMVNLTGDELRNRADNVDFTGPVQEVLTSMDNLHKPSTTNPQPLWTQVKDTEHIKNYIRQAVKLTWKMVIQRPSMKFDFNSEWRGERFQDIYWDSQMSDGARTYCVLPLLWHYQAHMSKGRIIFVHIDDEPNEKMDEVKQKVEEDESTSPEAEVTQL